MKRVKRAIIMAAGKGSRMEPVSNCIPKPLIPVKGRPMIETGIQALQQNGINEINIVVGYLKEKYNYLKKKYNGINLIENPYYESCNNISSLYVARELLCDVLIMDGDQVVNNREVLTPFFDMSCYNAVYVSKHTDEWLLNLKDGFICDCSPDGGSEGWQLYSISRWDKETGEKLKAAIEREFEENNNQIYWDNVPLILHLEDFQLGIKEMNYGDVVELDSIEELAAYDNEYEKYLGGRGNAK